MKKTKIRNKRIIADSNTSQTIKPTKLADQSQRCTFCNALYGDELDLRKDEEWLACRVYQLWFHESCAESYGVFDDAYFVCKDCVEN